jgi:hypothetical protein
LQIFQPSYVKYVIHLGVTEVSHGDHTAPPKFGGQQLPPSHLKVLGAIQPRLARKLD